MTELLLLLLALLLTLACAVFVAAEFSLTTVERGQLERAAAAGEKGAGGALRAARALTFQLSGAQLGITVTSLVIGMLAEPSLAELLRGPLRSAGLPEGVASSLAVALGVAASTVVLMVVGELVPKNWAISRPLVVARTVAGPLRTFTAAFAPFIRHLNETANRLVRLLGLEPTEELASARTPQELMALAQHSAAEGVLPPDSAELFVRTLHLGELTAENVMTPRVDVHALAADATAADAANLTLATGLSRFPVYRDGLDDVIGVVHIKAVLALDESARPDTPVASLAAEPLLVPDSLPVDRLLERRRGTGSLAVVVDEYGGTAGVVTLEDIVEEVVGEVRDEHDPAEQPGLARTGARTWEADGSLRVDRLAAVGMPVPEGPYETVAGLVAAELARIPLAGDRIRVADWGLTVLLTARHRAERVRITAPGNGNGNGNGNHGGHGGHGEGAS
ncbi:hemolysin family protein [Streptomyces specialis]|uniref:hemolysin family protein n=1 Tax=Streptomyces specialis TaxID=498367 RepID=UPI00099E59C0|nr:hemolysin family protein [Streptomyces specialis]